ncbi:2,5-dichloro-2,5-cyclohexadiene-1,4-diol dehydrogenase [Pandoraea captiosa]|uniref:2,5-dichloro-2,5-cyclohexadiene-1,4-diol dehydrogenase n=1 Tax=Pandoraea captiosa TaxID=2508302 RepID=A0A5E5ABS6_9BURK|nr:SDR family oxidoreductase [Pandoraea captiosa]VVE69995.1 2,5-dichloro-2,5-cyclohexadiene-1,4-diol dehydrogenase [Pandoraea captiosa]
MTHANSFAGKVVLVTGAASGIGRAVSAAFANEGATVVVADMQVDAGEQVVADLRSRGTDASFFRADVSDPQACLALVGHIRKHYGRLDAACNNAGIADGPTPPATHEVPVEHWRRMIDIDLSGVFYCLQAELPLMLETGGGAIVNTASLQSYISFPRTAAYTAAKHGVLGLTKTVAKEYGAQGIRCNAVAPGIVDTPLTHDILVDQRWRNVLEEKIPLGRTATPEDIARVMVWLCSPASEYVNGACLPVDGGFLA